MENLELTKAIKTELPIIREGFKILHEDDIPILFTGYNRFGNRIIGSLAEEDDLNKCYKYFHSIVDSYTFIDFLKQRISYRNVLEIAETVFVITKPYNGDNPIIYTINYNDLPLSYLPLEDSYCPNYDLNYGLEFLVKLKGKVADKYMALANDLGQIQQSFVDLFSKSFKLLKNFPSIPQIFQMAYSPSSFKLHYCLEFNKGLFPDEFDLSRFLITYLEYCIKYLPEDVEAILNSQTPDSLEYKLFKGEIERVYQAAAIIKPESIDEIIKNEIIHGAYSLGNISDLIGESFNEIEIFNEADSVQVPIGIINCDSKDRFEKVIHTIEEKTATVAITSGDFNISIYSLNIESRNGSAILIEKDYIERPKIHISGTQHLEKTKYAESLYQNSIIKVKGSARRVNGKIKQIEIEFEEC